MNSMLYGQSLAAKWSFPLTITSHKGSGSRRTPLQVSVSETHDVISRAEVDHAARRAAERKRKEARSKLTERLDRIDAVMTRADTVLLEMGEGGWRANGRFEVTIHPPSCTCPGWTLRWNRVPLAGRRANRNPCVHIAAAALQEGITDPEALLSLVRRAKE